MHFMMHVFQTVKACEPHAMAATSEAQQTQEEKDGGRTSALGTMVGVLVSLLKIQMSHLPQEQEESWRATFPQQEIKAVAQGW